MRARAANILDEEGRQRIAAEVLELGETLFDLALEHIEWEDTEVESNAESGKGAISDALLRAKNEFFIALRLLHDL